MKIVINVRNEYGMNRAYPANEAAHLFACIAGQKTLTLATLKRVKQLGFEIEQETPATDLAFMEGIA